MRTMTVKRIDALTRSRLATVIVNAGGALRALTADEKYAARLRRDDVLGAGYL